MKYQLILILDHGDLVDELFKDLSLSGYNATVLGARSIKHLLEDEESEHMHFISLGRLDSHLSEHSTYCYFLVNEDRLSHLKEIIREKTNSFKNIKGAMFSFPISDYEGTI